MSDADALERRLLPPKAKGTRDEFWQLATRRSSLAESEAGTHRESQHLALAALFAGRGFQAGERDSERLSAYLALFRRAQAKRCFPHQLKTVEARIRSELRVSASEAEPRVLTKKAKTLVTHVALYFVADAKTFDAISEDESLWSDDDGMRATVQSGRGVFIYTGSDGLVHHEIRLVDGDLSLSPREYDMLTSSSEPVLLSVPSGVLRVGEPYPVDPLELAVEPGVYRVALYNLDCGERCIIVAVRTPLADATNTLPEERARYGQSTPGILITDGG